MSAIDDLRAELAAVRARAAKVHEHELEAARSDIEEGRHLLLLACSRFQSAIDRVDFNTRFGGDHNLALEWLHEVSDATEVAPLTAQAACVSR